MSALYAMRFSGANGDDVGAVYVGKGAILGVDTENGRYSGSYTEDGGRIQATITLTFPDGGRLVTGDQVPPGATIPLTADWPVTFADGSDQRIMVSGQPVNVTFEKIGDIL